MSPGDSAVLAAASLEDEQEQEENEAAAAPAAGAEAPLPPPPRSLTRRLLSAAVPLAIVAAGVGLFVTLASLRPPPPPAVVPERKPPQVPVVPATPGVIPLEIVAYGSARARDGAELTAERAGRIAWVSPELWVGRFVPQGEELVRLDDHDSRLNLRLAEAELAQTQASLRRLERSQPFLEREREILQESVGLAEAEWKRRAELYERGSGTRDDADRFRRQYVAELLLLQRRREELELLPLELERLRAQLAQREANVAQARLDLERCSLGAPIAGRIVLRGAEPGRSVTLGQVVAGLAADAVTEVTVKIPATDAQKLARWPAASIPPRAQLPPEWVGQAKARVTWLEFGDQATWTAKVVQIEPIDPATRTVPVVLAIDEPYALLASQRLLITAGAFCRVVLEGRREPGCLVVPERALSGGEQVFLAREGVLTPLPVELVHRADDECVVRPRGSLRPGDLLVTSPPEHAIPGMRVEPLE